MRNQVIIDMAEKYVLAMFLSVFAVFWNCGPAWADLTIQTETEVNIELTGYDSLSEYTLFKAEIGANSMRRIATPYRGLALLSFPGGWSYPVIIGDKSLTIQLVAPGESPRFAGSAENDYFYGLLSGAESARSDNYHFANIMLQSRNLLESTRSVKTIAELAAKKKEIHQFVATHYEDLKHSDMIRRLVEQYFMMHEYADYHEKGKPATDIKVKFQREVVDGVNRWLKDLAPHISRDAALNYIVSLYYGRSMVSLASHIIANFRQDAYCPGERKDSFTFPDHVLVKAPYGRQGEEFKDFGGGKKIIAFVSDDCPVSMVETVAKARQAAINEEEIPVIVASLQELSEAHLGLARMLSSKNVFFIDDEKWRSVNLPEKIYLPLFLTIGAETDQARE